MRLLGASGQQPARPGQCECQWHLTFRWSSTMLGRSGTSDHAGGGMDDIEVRAALEPRGGDILPGPAEMENR